MLRLNTQEIQVTGNDFAHLKGKRLLEGNDIGRVQELSYAVHTRTEWVSKPFWATEIQDIIENKCVKYTPDEISNEEFLGLSIKAQENELELSLGTVGRRDYELTVVFRKEVDEEGFQVLGDMIRFKNVSALSA